MDKSAKSDDEIITSGYATVNTMSENVGNKFEDFYKNTKYTLNCDDVKSNVVYMFSLINTIESIILKF